MDLRRVNRIAHIVALPVCHISDQALRFSQFPADDLDNIDIPHFIVAAHIIDFTHTAFMNDQVNRSAVVLYIEPVADIFSLPIDRKRLIVQRIGNHQGNQLLREVIWSVVIGAPADRHREPVSSVIGENQKIRSSFRRTVRAACVNRRLLRKEEIRSVKREITVNLICTNTLLLNLMQPPANEAHTLPDWNLPSVLTSLV